MDEITLTFNSPITEEQYDAIMDVDFDHTDRIWFNTKHGKTVEFVKASQWILVKTRPMDEEERKYYLEELGWSLDDSEAVMFDSLMPGDGQEVWVCSKCGNVWQDTCVIDEGIGLEENGDWLDIVAWMPFERPKPWRGEYDGESTQD